MSVSPEDPEWTVNLYRKTESLGWQVLEARQVQAGGNAVVTTTTTTAASSRKRRAVSSALRACPRKEAIIVRKLRLKINLEPHSTVVTRRRNRIKIDSNRGARSLILVFKDAIECRTFSDRLARLNPLLCLQMQDGGEQLNSRSIVGGERNTQTGTKKKQQLEEQLVQTTRRHPEGLDYERQEVFSYVARLLQAPDFISYMTGLESALLRQPDGVRLLQDLVEDYPAADDLYEIRNTQQESDTRHSIQHSINQGSHLQMLGTGGDGAPVMNQVSFPGEGYTMHPDHTSYCQRMEGLNGNTFGTLLLNHQTQGWR